MLAQPPWTRYAIQSPWQRSFIVRWHTAPTRGDQARTSSRRPTQPNDDARPLAETEAESTDRARSRHLLRAILRECSYLPDSQARVYVRWYAISRFRDSTSKAWQNRADSSYASRLKAKQQQAQVALNKLQRAAEGEFQPLRAVLFLTYGRTGRRRRELVTQLLREQQGPQRKQSSPPQDAAGGTEASAHLSPHQSLQPEPANKAKHVTSILEGSTDNPYMPALSPRLQALMESQIKLPPTRTTRPTLRRMHPIIPEQNSWLRPMPQVRVKNLTRKWFADALGKIHPPLPVPEWKRLHDLSLGTRTESLPSRRKAAEPSKKSALDLQLTSSRIDPSRLFTGNQAHTITPRYMRRLWTQVFEQCPRLDWNVEQQEWKVLWGSHALHAVQSITTSPPTTRNDEVEVAK
nr:hypothetical protein CFP56_16940 [Quercus suber]POE94709.1 hypothetical protein CFP56_16946 [Quercus suber]